MATRPAKPAPIALAVNIAIMAVPAVFVHRPKQLPKILLVQAKLQTPKPAFMLGNVRRLPKRKQGVKEAVVPVAIAGNMANKIRSYGNP